MIFYFNPHIINIFGTRVFRTIVSYDRENKKSRYRREDCAMLQYISIRIEFYNGIARFLCLSTTFLYSPTSATVQMLKLHKVC